VPTSFKDAAAAAARALQQWYGADSYAASTGLYHYDDPDLAQTIGWLGANFASLYGGVDHAQDTARWWNSANAITALTEYMLLTRDYTYLGVLDNTFNKAPTAWTINQGTLIGAGVAGATAGAGGGALVGAAVCGPPCALVGGFLGAFAGLFGGSGGALQAAKIFYTNFLNNFYDDEGWWALAWIKAYDLTSDQKYLNMAVTIFNDMKGGWDNTCNGGIYWAKDHKGPDGNSPYKNAIANELLIAVAAALYLRYRPDGKPVQDYLDKATQGWRWFRDSSLINPRALVNDALNTSCINDGTQAVWTYNQGVILGALCDLFETTGDSAFLKSAQQIADALIHNLVFVPKQEWIGNNTTASMPFVTPDGWVYFQGTDWDLTHGAGTLWKVFNDGSHQSPVGNNTTASTPFVTPDGWVYFQGTDNKLWKIATGGDPQTQTWLNNWTNSTPFVTSDGWVYFQGIDKKLWKIATSGDPQTQVWLGSLYTNSTPFVTPDGWVYFQRDNNNLSKIATSGDPQTLAWLSRNMTYSTPFVTPDGWVYFQGYGNELGKIATSGDPQSQSQVGNNTTASTPFVTPDGWVYFRGTDLDLIHGKGKLWKVFKDGSQQSQIGGNTTASTPFVTPDGWVYFQGTDNKLWRVTSRSTPESGINNNGILAEYTDLNDDIGHVDNCQFKGIFVRNLARLYVKTHALRYRTFLLKNAVSALTYMKKDSNQFGKRWYAELDVADFVRQTAALDLLNAAILVQLSVDLSYLDPLLLSGG
jgi:predicted alpha-1,6-mannanase (GH76 family)